MSLRQRFPTALILLAVLFALVQWASPPVFFLVIQALVIAALIEFYNLAKKKKLEPRPAVGIGFALMIGASFYFTALPFELALIAGLLLAGLYYLVAVNTIEKVMAFPGSFAITIFGAVYVAFTSNYLYVLKAERGPLYLYFLFAVVFLGDSGAFFVGKLLGRHKMTPLASPSKTWEGALGGIIFAAIGAVLARELLLKEVGLEMVLLCGVVVHAAAQVSDPLESLFKRAVGVKDSSRLLPGHGGFLDRIDSLLFAAPLFYYFVRYIWKG
jgi:phosphatidate cytidylyltransferase